MTNCSIISYASQTFFMPLRLCTYCSFCLKHDSSLSCLENSFRLSRPCLVFLSFVRLLNFTNGLFPSSELPWHFVQMHLSLLFVSEFLVLHLSPTRVWAVEDGVLHRYLICIFSASPRCLIPRSDFWILECCVLLTPVHERYAVKGKHLQQLEEL